LATPLGGRAFIGKKSREIVVVEREERDFFPPLSLIGGGAPTSATAAL
jgi:hypothetical protein